MTPDEAAREIEDLRSRVRRLEDALEGLLLYQPRLTAGLAAAMAEEWRRRAVSDAILGETRHSVEK